MTLFRHFFFSLILSLGLLYGEDEVYLKNTKGLLLVGNVFSVRKEGASLLEGVAYKDLQIPGGNEALTQKLLPLFSHKPLTESLINQLKQEIIFHYRKQHHPFVVVFVPEQEIANNTLQLVVMESVVGKIEVKGNKHTSGRRIKKKIRAKPGGPIDENQLLQDLSWINTYPFRNVSIVYSAGEKRGTTDIDLVVSDRKQWRIYVGGDNTGTPSIGRSRYFTGVNFGNVFFPENVFSAQYTTSADFRKFQGYTFQYAAPLPWRHTINAFGGYATIHPNIAPSFSSHGKSYQASGRYTVPLWMPEKKWLHQLSFEVGFDFKGTNNNLFFGTDNLQPIQTQNAQIAQFVFGGQVSLTPQKHRINAGLELFWSPGRMVKDQTDTDFQSLRPGATAKYFYGRFSYSHHYTLPYNGGLFGQFRMQLADANLLATEQFALGGYSTVRGYNERVVNGDDAVCFNFEVQTPSILLLGRWKKFLKDSFLFLGFIDVGYAWDHEKIPGLPEHQTLIGIGPGFRYRIDPYFTMRCDLGFPLHAVFNSKEHPRLHFSAVLSY